jgi:alpha-D-xyloside xylohydrolase
MVAEFPDDPACSQLDRQYMFGDRLLVAPVFAHPAETSYYIPAGTWTPQTGATVRGLFGSASVRLQTVPIFVRLDRCFRSARATTGRITATTTT